MFEADGFDPVPGVTEMIKVDDFSLCMADGEPQSFVGRDVRDQRHNIGLASQHLVGDRATGRPPVSLLLKKLKIVEELLIFRGARKIASSRHIKIMNLQPAEGYSCFH